MAECSQVSCKPDDPVTDTTDQYFDSYEDLDVHELMLKDEARTRAYQVYIEQNAALFADKIVVDIGAGTGILSLFAARAGAKQVYAIEASGMAILCEAIVEQNDLQDKITVIKSRAEEASLPEGVKADILISEWMGFYLLHESMLDSVLIARDRLLKPDGIMVPSVADLFICPVSMKEFHKTKFQYWNNVYGFDFSPVEPFVRQKTMLEPQIVTLNPDQCLSEPELVTSLDLKYAEVEDVKKVTGHFKFKMAKNGFLHGFACWFDVDFEGDVAHSLNTGPKAPETHWKQTVILLPDAYLVCKEEEIACSLNLQQSAANPRRYDICIEMPEEEDSADEDNGEDTEAAEMILSALNSKGQLS